MADRIAQAVVKDQLEQLVEPKFHEDSYGYRPRKSALDAVGYFVRTTGNVTDKMIKDYIDKHESRDDKFGNFQVEN